MAQLVERSSKNSSIFKASQYKSKQRDARGNVADPRGEARRLDHLNVLAHATLETLYMRTKTLSRQLSCWMVAFEDLGDLLVMSWKFPAAVPPHALLLFVSLPRRTEVAEEALRARPTTLSVKEVARLARSRPMGEAPLRWHGGGKRASGCRGFRILLPTRIDRVLIRGHVGPIEPLPINSWAMWSYCSPVRDPDLWIPRRTTGRPTSSASDRRGRSRDKHSRSIESSPEHMLAKFDGVRSPASHVESKLSWSQESK